MSLTPQMVAGDGLVADDILRAVRASLGLDSGDPVPPAQLVRLLRRNKIPLLSLVGSADGSPSATDSDPFLSSPELKAAVSADRAHYAEAHGEWVQLAEAWSRVGVRHICFKSAGIAPSFPYTSDNYDILVPAGSIVRARRVLLELGYVEMTNTEEPSKWLFRRFVAGRNTSLIHLHAEVTWGGGFMLVDEIWKRARQSADDPSTWVPGREDVILINVAHAVIENKEVGLHEIVKIRHAVGAGDVDWDYIDHVAQARGWRDALHLGLLVVAQLEDHLYGSSVIPDDRRARFQQTLHVHPWLGRYWSGLRAAPPRLPFKLWFTGCVLLYFQKLWGDSHLTVAQKLPDTALALIRGARQKSQIHLQSSMLVTLSGIDGSGKSGAAQALYDAFDVSHVRSRVVWTRINDTPGMRMLRHARGWYWRRQVQQHRGPGEAGHHAAAPVASEFRWRGRSLILWSIAATLDYAVWLQHVRWRMWRGEVAIADRYVCDFDLELTIRLREYPLLARALLSLVRCAAPRPARGYLLRIPPALSRERKTEPDGRALNMDEVCQSYEALIDRYKLRAFDATRPFEEIATAVVHDALTTYMRRFGPLVRSLFFMNPAQLNPSGWPHDDQAAASDGERPS